MLSKFYQFSVKSANTRSSDENANTNNCVRIAQLLTQKPDNIILYENDSDSDDLGSAGSDGTKIEKEDCEIGADLSKPLKKAKVSENLDTALQTLTVKKVISEYTPSIFQHTTITSSIDEGNDFYGSPSKNKAAALICEGNTGKMIEYWNENTSPQRLNAAQIQAEQTPIKGRGSLDSKKTMSAYVKVEDIYKYAQENPLDVLPQQSLDDATRSSASPDGINFHTQSVELNPLLSKHSDSRHILSQPQQKVVRPSAEPQNGCQSSAKLSKTYVSIDAPTHFISGINLTATVAASSSSGSILDLFKSVDKSSTNKGNTDKQSNLKNNISDLSVGSKSQTENNSSEVVPMQLFEKSSTVEISFAGITYLALVVSAFIGYWYKTREHS